MPAGMDAWKFRDLISKHHGSLRGVQAELKVDAAQMKRYLKSFKCADYPAWLKTRRRVDAGHRRVANLRKFAGIRRWEWSYSWDLREQLQIVRHTEHEVLKLAAAHPPDLRFTNGRMLAAAVIAVQTGVCPTKAFRRLGHPR